MKSILSPAQMYALEAQHFSAGMSTLSAIENASAVFIDEVKQFIGTLREKTVYAACGSGNNAGDGYAAARIAQCAGASVKLIAMSPVDHLKGDAAINAARAINECGIPCLTLSELSILPPPDLWIDALFGIGLNRPIGPEYHPLLDRMEKDRASGSIIASVDVPSGLNAATGWVEGKAVHADLTVTFEYAKLGHYLLDGMDCTGKLVVRSIGMTWFPVQQPVMLIEPEDASIAFPPRRRNTHKGSYGHVLVIAGSMGMCGAAAYAAHAALRSGAGLITLACPKSITPVLQTILPAAMCIPLPEENGALCKAACPFLADALKGKNAVIIGPGLSRRASKEVIRITLESGLPAVVDADALNLIAESQELRALLRPHHIITPHLGEASRLISLSGASLRDADALHEMGPVALLKGASSLIVGSLNTKYQRFLSISGCAGMATGGSGDVLCGIMGALLARGMDALSAAWCASEIHGLCGEAAAQRMGEVCMTASDLIDSLPDVVRKLTKPSKSR